MAKDCCFDTLECKTTSVHNDLAGRSQPDCHPAEAISFDDGTEGGTNLQNKIEEIEDVVSSIDEIRSEVDDLISEIGGLGIGDGILTI